MREWRTVPLAQVADIRVSNVDKKFVVAETPVSLCNYMDVYANEYICSDLPFMSASATEAEIARFKIQRGDVLITKDSETPDDIGIPAVVSEDIQNLVCGYHLALIRPNQDEVDPVFLCKQLARPETACYFGRYAAGSTRYGLSIRALARTPTALAPMDQQRKIVAILTSLDTAIEKTEALIEKHQQIKAGLMHDLFTRGVLPDGQLRQSEAVTTPYGDLPSGWRLGSILELTDPSRQPILTGPFGADLGQADFVDDGVPVLRIGNVQQGFIDSTSLLFVSRSKAATLSRYRIRQGDLLFARQGATTGRNALADEVAEGSLINYHIIRVALDHARCAPLFVEAAFAADIVKRQIERDKGRGTREGINTAQIKFLAFPLTDVDEQRRIAEALGAQAGAIRNLKIRRGKLKMEKAGLMQSLLTGGVTVRTGTAMTETASA